jgi:hypothetical protein
MTADEIIYAWVPWSTGEAARYKTKADAVADLRYQLFEAGFVIVPRVASEAVIEAGCQEATNNGDYAEAGEFVPRINGAVWKAMVEEATKP